jgi:PfaD family protein
VSGPLPAIGVLVGSEAPVFDRAGLPAAAAQFRRAAHVVAEPRPPGRIGVAFGGHVQGGDLAVAGALPVLGTLPPLFPEWLGDRSFSEVHGTRFPYMAGAMANGIATTDLVIAMARAGMLGAFGAAGLLPAAVAAAIDRLQAALTTEPYAVNLIHSPQEPHREAEIVELLLQRRVNRVEASAFMGLTPPLVRYACTGLHRLQDGSIARRTHVIAKISRAEVARKFLSPAPREIVEALVRAGRLTPDEAALSATVPLADDLTCEADSGGHTDHRALGVLLPLIANLRDQLAAHHGYTRPIRVGAAGGIGTPAAVAGAFAMGAAYVLTGSINQGCVESGVSATARSLLAKADMADVARAPAADMFELGVTVQVLKRGTLFASRAQRLYEAYSKHESLDAMSAAERAGLEKDVLGTTLAEAWTSTENFFAERDPRQLERAARDAKHKMALVFRWYLGKSSRWAIDGTPERALDYQLWCGPAMGAFNDWVRGSFLEAPENRSAPQVARNLLEGAAAITRAGQLRSYGVPMPDAAFHFTPRPLA